jgi:hypothetical protein
LQFILAREITIARLTQGLLIVVDPDGHKLEAHVGDLASRLAACRQRPYAGMKFFDDQ